MALLFANNAATTVAVNLGIGVTSLVLASGTGALFPNPTGGDYFEITLTDAATGIRTEICNCTARSADTLTIARAQQGTSDQAWLVGDLAANLFTAGAAATIQGAAAGLVAAL